MALYDSLTLNAHQMRCVDEALKNKLLGLFVTDANSPAGGRAVTVKFRLPETELSNLAYPLITIEHAGYSRDPEREHRGYINLAYSPEGLPIWWDPAATSYDPNASPYQTYFPIPYNFDYLVTLYTRSWVEHHMPVSMTLMSENYLGSHFGSLIIPEDGTIRTMFVLGQTEPTYTKDNDGKRRYQTAWKVRVVSEWLWDVTTPVPLTDLHLDLSVYEDVATLSVKDLEESFDMMSVGTPIGWKTSA